MISKDRDIEFKQKFNILLVLEEKALISLELDLHNKKSTFYR